MGKRLSALFNEAALPPEGWREDFFRNMRGENLRYGHAPASPDVPARGTVVMTHGYGEHIELYYHAIRFYQQRGFDVWMMEWQGHGKSDRDDPVCRTSGNHRTAPRGMLSHMKDLEKFVNEVVQPDRSRPVIMSTNSMGGHIGLLAMKYNPAMFDGAVMSTPMFDIARLGLPVSWRGVMRFIFDTAAKTPLADKQLPGDFKVLNWLTGLANNRTGDEPNIRAAWAEAARRKYADLQIDRPSFGWVSAAYRTIAPSLKDSFLHAVQTPMLIGSAGQDNLVDNAAHVRVAEKTRASEILHLPTAQHSLWFENDGNYRNWTDSIDRFLDRIAPAQKAAPPAPAPLPRPEWPLAA